MSSRLLALILLGLSLCFTICMFMLDPDPMAPVRFLIVGGLSFMGAGTGHAPGDADSRQGFFYLILAVVTFVLGLLFLRRRPQ